jgi:Bacterial Ig-like domain
VHYRDLDYLEFVPETDLVAGSTYTVTVKAGLRDLDGHLLDSDYSWQFVTDARSASGLWTPMEPDDQMPALSDARAVWTGTKAIVYGWELGDVGDFGIVGEGRNGGGIYDPATDTWQPGFPPSGQPSSRFSFTATWNGSSMIIWGGRFGDAIRGDGALYDPESDAWAPLTPPVDLNIAATYSHTAIWTGTELIVWGGLTANEEATNQGFAYEPGTDQWRALSAVGAPSPRYAATAVWTGTEVVIWGGSSDDGEALANGARYDPIADTWTPLPTAATAFGPDSSSAVWTGSELLVWNGGKTEAGQTLNDRFRETTLRLYNPVTDSWRSSDSGWEPFYGFGFRAYWTGSQLLTFASNAFDGAYSYDSLTDSWQPIANDPVMIRSGPVSVWAGSRLVVWSGTLSIFPIADGTVFRP